MKLLLTAFLCGLCGASLSQDIFISYINKRGTTTTIPITKETRNLGIAANQPFDSFKVLVKNLPKDHKIIFIDDAGEQIGVVLHTDEAKTLTAANDLSNQMIRIIHEDDGSVRRDFATVLIQNLPRSQLNIVTHTLSLGETSNKVCAPCSFAENALTYDYATNTLSYEKKKKWTNGRPLVGYPFTFLVKNINPFRDSVIISSEFSNFNTDVPDLFTRAFFSPSLQSLDEQQMSLLADILALDEQLKRIVEILKNARECEEVCQAIQKVKDSLEKYFKEEYEFDEQSSDLIPFIIARLEGIAPLYQDSVAKVLNNYRKFYQARNYVNYYVPKVQNVDEYVFNLSILPKVGASASSMVDHQPISVSTVGGFKVDFSSGLFITSLRDDRYTLKGDSTIIESSYGGDSIVYDRRNLIIRQSDGKGLDFGVSALMHFYPRLTPSVNLALALGAGVSVGPDPAIRYLGGASLLLGRKGRFIISYGWAAGFVDRLDDAFQADTFTSVSDKKNLLKRSFETKNFWSLTFNIPLFKTKVNISESKNKESKEEVPKTDGKTDQAAK